MAHVSTVTHVIFDVDGLILDTERLYTEITTILCAKYNKTFEWKNKVKMMGKKEREAGQMLIDDLQLPITVDDYIDMMRKLQKEAFPQADLLPGAEELIRHLHRHSIPICVATGSDSETYQLKTAGHQELFGLFHHAVLSGSDPEVKSGKPAPDCFLLAARRFPTPPDPAQCLVLEDAPNGVQAALAAGMRVVWVPSDPRADCGQLTGGDVTTLANLSLFKPEDFGLPPFTS